VCLLLRAVGLHQGPHGYPDLLEGDGYVSQFRQGHGHLLVHGVARLFDLVDFADAEPSDETGDKCHGQKSCQEFHAKSQIQKPVHPNPPIARVDIMPKYVYFEAGLSQQALRTGSWPL